MTEAPYADIPDAVAFHEEPRLADLWETIRASGQAPHTVVTILVQNADWTLSLAPGGSLSRARSQMDHPAFLRYVAAKLGAM